jgi:hypothetical protein
MLGCGGGGGCSEGACVLPGGICVTLTGLCLQPTAVMLSANPITNNFVNLVSFILFVFREMGYLAQLG